ncbi:MAG TPA: chromate transporter [Candidatus Binataceae bacterium]|nr:chromate transporter [Candidatus Binataceae bacterium]
MSNEVASSASDKASHERPSLATIFKIFLIAGGISFGGGVVAYLREYIVRDEKWLNDDQFLDALEVSETLPGLNSVNMSVITGDRLRGTIGAVVAVAGLMIPGTIMMMVLGVLWSENPHNLNIKDLLIGIAAAAVGLLTTVTLQLGRKQFMRPIDLALILATFAEVSLMHVSLPWALLTVGGIAIWIYRPVSGVPKDHERYRHLHDRVQKGRHSLWRY